MSAKIRPRKESRTGRWPPLLSPRFPPCQRHGKNRDNTRQSHPPQNATALPDERYAPFGSVVPDARFESPMYRAVLAACDQGPESSYKMRCQIAMAAVTLEDVGFTVADVEMARSRWYLPRAPVPSQLQDSVCGLLRRGEGRVRRVCRQSSRYRSRRASR